MMLEAKVELVISLTSKKLLKLRDLIGIWPICTLLPMRQTILPASQFPQHPKFFEPKNSSAVVSFASRWPDYF